MSGADPTAGLTEEERKMMDWAERERNGVERYAFGHQAAAFTGARYVLESLTALAESRRRAADLEAALRAVEWRGYGGFHHGIVQGTCITCHRWNDEGHKPDCSLAAALAASAERIGESHGQT